MWFFSEQCSRIILFLDILASKADVAARTKVILITMVGPTISMTNGSSRPCQLGFAANWKMSS